MKPSSTDPDTVFARAYVYKSTSQYLLARSLRFVGKGKGKRRGNVEGGRKIIDIRKKSISIVCTHARLDLTLRTADFWGKWGIGSEAIDTCTIDFHV